METLHTKRLILRHMDKNDAEEVFEYSKNPKVGIDAGWEPHKNIEETRQIMDEIFIGQETMWGIVLKESGKLIGSVGLIDDPMRENPHVKMLGYAIGETHWGKGITTEGVNAVLEYAFETLNLSGISVTCYDYNKASERVIQKAGFAYEGTLKQAEIRYDGQVMSKKCFFLENMK